MAASAQPSRTSSRRSAYDLEAGRPEARERAEQRLAEVKSRFSSSIQQTGKEEDARAARRRLTLDRPLTDFVRRYAEPAYGDVLITERSGRLDYGWGGVFGPAELYDPSKGQLRIEIAGGGQIVTFEFAGSGPAKSLSLQGVTFVRRTVIAIGVSIPRTDLRDQRRRVARCVLPAKDPSSSSGKAMSGCLIPSPGRFDPQCRQLDDGKAAIH